MFAFSQDLKDFERAHVIRIGPQAKVYGDPWDYIVTCVTYDGETAILIGFKGDGKVTPAVVRAAVTEARRLGYSKVAWQRLNHANPRLIDVTRKSGSGTP